jgi:hypothetical protein
MTKREKTSIQLIKLIQSGAITPPEGSNVEKMQKDLVFFETFVLDQGEFGYLNPPLPAARGFGKPKGVK